MVGFLSIMLVGDDDLRGLNDSCLFQCGISAVFGHCFNCAGGQFHRDELFEFGYPYTTGFQVRRESTLGIGCDVTAYAALLLGHTAPVNYASFGNTCFCDAANLRHKIDPVEIEGG